MRDMPALSTPEAQTVMLVEAGDARLFTGAEGARRSTVAFLNHISAGLSFATCAAARRGSSKNNAC
jgi:hypothetical protein